MGAAIMICRASIDGAPEWEFCASAEREADGATDTREVDSGHRPLDTPSCCAAIVLDT